eukprot:284235_1
MPSKEACELDAQYYKGWQKWKQSYNPNQEHKPNSEKLKQLRVPSRSIALYDIANPQNCSTSKETIDNIPCYWIKYKGSNIENGIIIILHGGGYVKNSATVSFAEGEYMSKLTGCHVLSVDYSLCPEFPLPHSVKEVYCVYKYLVNIMKIPTSKIAINGASAGGGLVLLVLQEILRKKEIDLPACAWMESPWTNLGSDLPSVKRNWEMDPVINLEMMYLTPQFACGNWDKDMNVINDNNAKNEIYSPLFGTFKNLCPLYFMVGATEVLLDDTLEAAKKAYESGVNVKVDIHPFMIHVWPSKVRIHTEAREAVVRGCDWIMKQFKRFLI